MSSVESSLSLYTIFSSTRTVQGFTNKNKYKRYWFYFYCSEKEINVIFEGYKHFFISSSHIPKHKLKETFLLLSKESADSLVEHDNLIKKST